MFGRLGDLNAFFLKICSAYNGVLTGTYPHRLLSVYLRMLLARHTHTPCTTHPDTRVSECSDCFHLYAGFSRTHPEN